MGQGTFLESRGAEKLFQYKPAGWPRSHYREGSKFAIFPDFLVCLDLKGETAHWL